MKKVFLRHFLDCEIEKNRKIVNYVLIRFLIKQGQSHDFICLKGDISAHSIRVKIVNCFMTKTFDMRSI
ncbi:unnamed protein product [Rhizophagus irregularis]|nr:unnamed protein product [Rhizophagus irregularis]